MGVGILGDMRHRITLNNPNKIDNGRGGWKIDYDSGLRQSIWAAVDVVKISQRLQYRQDDEAPQLVFTIRENPFVKKETRILFDGATYKITEQEPHKENPRFWNIRAREV